MDCLGCFIWLLYTIPLYTVPPVSIPGGLFVWVNWSGVRFHSLAGGLGRFDYYPPRVAWEVAKVGVCVGF